MSSEVSEENKKQKKEHKEKNSRIARVFKSLSFNAICMIVIMLIMLSSLLTIIGVENFSRSFKREYAQTTYYMARTAADLVNGDHLEQYLAGEETGEYEEVCRDVQSFCDNISVSMIYVIMVDRSDYGRFVCVVDSICNEVDNTNYTQWELGYKRDTTNDEYREKYRRVYEQESPYETVYRIKVNDGQHPHVTTIVPVKNSAGEVAALLCMQRPARELEDARRPYIVSVAITTAILLLIFIGCGSFFLNKDFIKPVLRISAETARFAKENTKSETLENFKGYRELVELAGSIGIMETDMVRHMKDLEIATAERERMGTELSFARTIQVNSIPCEFPAFPDRDEFDIYGSMKPAYEVGGDFFNFYFVDDSHIALVIGDISGKGIPASLFMMVVNIMIGDRTGMGGTPAEILTFVNEHICEHNDADMFSTIWLGIVDLRTGNVTATNAGHEELTISHGGGDYEIYKTPHDLAVGVISGTKYRDYEFHLDPGDKIFLYTDGLTEATRGDETMLTMKGALEVMSRYKDCSPEETIKGVYKSVNEFVEGAPQFDDLTMLCFEMKKYMD